MTRSLTQSLDSTLDSIQILPSRWRDVPAVHALERACFGPDAWSWLELVVLLFSAGVRLRAVADGRLVGFVAGERKPAEGCAWIITVGVLPEYQRHGIGEQLLIESEVRLAMPAIKLTVRESNHGAIALYRKLGYTPQYTVPRYYSGGETGVVMEKNVNRETSRQASK